MIYVSYMLVLKLNNIWYISAYNLYDLVLYDSE